MIQKILIIRAMRWYIGRRIEYVVLLGALDLRLHSVCVYGPRIYPRARNHELPPL